MQFKINSDLPQFYDKLQMTKINIQQSFVSAGEATREYFYNSIVYGHEDAFDNADIEIVAMDNSVTLDIAGVDENVLLYKYGITLEQITQDLNTYLLEKLQDQIAGVFR